MSLRQHTHVVDASKEICGTTYTLATQYGEFTVTIPPGYVASDFRSPEKGDVYLTREGSPATAIADLWAEPYLILSETPKPKPVAKNPWEL